MFPTSISTGMAHDIARAHRQTRTNPVNAQHAATIAVARTTTGVSRRRSMAAIAAAVVIAVVGVAGISSSSAPVDADAVNHHGHR